MTIRPLSLLLCSLLILLCPAHLRAQSSSLNFAEEFALSNDRQKVLEQLIPGTEDYYYYRALERQLAGAFNEVPAILATWVDRLGRSQRVVEIENRQALLNYEADPKTTFNFLVSRLGGISFDHRQEVEGATDGLSSTLDPALIAFETLAAKYLALEPTSLSRFTDSGIQRLLGRELSMSLLRDFLNRIDTPDFPQLADLVLRELDSEKSSGFGSLKAHGLLVLDQLDYCAERRRSLLNDDSFIDNYLRRLLPSDDINLNRNDSARSAYLSRLVNFARRLPPAQNSLKAHVFYHSLLDGLKKDSFDESLLKEYLRIPRANLFSNEDYLRSRPAREAVANLKVLFPTGLARIGDDESLVRHYLEQLLKDADSCSAYEEFLNKRWLERVFAETKILAGTGNTERWYSLLGDANYYESLRERVEIEFVPHMQRYYRSDDAVAIELDVKNVDTLLIKIYEINAANYYRDFEKEIDASLKIEGLVASREETIQYEVSPFQRVRRKIQLPGMERAGTYIVELIGNGLSSRAVIRKGQLHAIERMGAAGPVFRVFNEDGDLQKSAAIRLGANEFQSDEDGEIRLPFSTAPGVKTIVLVSGSLASIEKIQHSAETYRLDAGFHVDRESLIEDHSARVLLRPTLLLNGEPVSLKLLENRLLRVYSRDAQGVTSSMEIRDVVLRKDREFAFDVQVPAELRQLWFEFSGEVNVVSRNRRENLSVTSRYFSINGVRDSRVSAMPFLGRTEAGYTIDLLGLNGEARPGQGLRFSFQHHDFKRSIDLQLVTDAKGRIQLGALNEIDEIRIAWTDNSYLTWQLSEKSRAYPKVIQSLAGNSVFVPMPDLASGEIRDQVSFIELRGGRNFRDCIDKVHRDGHFLELRALDAGDYRLNLKATENTIEIRVGAGAKRADWILGEQRFLRMNTPCLLDFKSIAIDGEDLILTLSNANTSTRVHLFATRYLPAFDILEDLDAPGLLRPVELKLEDLDSSYESGRKVADEYRYILERRFATKFPGNMLDRPSLLLNPWAIDESNATIGLGGGSGGSYGGRRGGSKNARRGRGARALQTGLYPAAFASLEFLPRGSQVLSNLQADENGQIRVKLSDLGDGHIIHAMAVQGEDSVYARKLRSELELKPKDKRLLRPLNPQGHFAEDRSIQFLDANGSATIADRTTTKLKYYDDLASVYRLFLTLNPQSELDKFAFILDWPSYDREKKNALYSKFACHELHFFLKAKDPSYFDEVIRPYLSNKAYRSFLDDYLLDSDLSPYVTSWAFSQLNLVERILLTRKLEALSGGIKRHIQDLYDLKSPDQSRLSLLFAAALNSDSLNDSHDELQDALGQKMNEPAPPGSAGPMKKPTRFSADEEAKDKSEAPSEEYEEGVEDPVEADDDADDFSPDRQLGDVAEELGRSDRRRKRADSKDLALRGAYVAGYQAPAATQRLVEQNYWNREIHQSGPEMIDINAFWLDFSKSDPGQAFFSTHFIEATSNLSEMMFALSLLDLPFKATEHKIEVDGKELRLKAGSPLLLVREELRPASLSEETTPILVSQSFFKSDDPFYFEGNERREKYVTKEFLVGVAYGCRVVLTNPSSSPRKLELLLQIPEGAIPLQKGFETKGLPAELSAYGTTTAEFHFYFPKEGEFQHFPVHATLEGEVVTSAQPVTMKVVRELTEIDTKSWDYVSQYGSPEQVMAHLEQANLGRLDLKKVAWRFKDRDFFQAAIDRVASRHFFDRTLWSYALFHRDEDRTREFLSHEDGFVAACGAAIESRLLTIDPVQRKAYRHVEFSPLFHGRAHQFGKSREILDLSLLEQYNRLMQILGYRSTLDSDDWMTVTYYFLLQDRIEEALGAFKRVDAAALETRIQYDYMLAYLDFFSKDHALARDIAAAYVDHPVERWRAMFRNIINQLDEAEGKGVSVANPEDRDQTQTASADEQPSLEFKVESRKIQISYGNLKDCEIGFYEMDVEFLFSSNPFVDESGGTVAYVRPNLSMPVALLEGQNKLEVDLPESYRNSNLLIEIRAGGLVKRQTYFANSLRVQVMENYGQLKVTSAESQEALSKVYVKVFAREASGRVRFHKDGYTDIRGRFDYASLSGPDSKTAERYAILILSEDRGAVIRSVESPLQ